MTHGWTRWAHEWFVKYALADEAERPTTFDALLYDDSADDIQNTDDIGDISTEPTDGSYARESVRFGTDTYTNIHPDGTAVRVDPHLAFDLTNTTGTYDSVAFVWDAVTEKDKWAAWGEGEGETWEDDYVTDGPQPWEEDSNFDETAVAPSEHLMVREELAEPLDATEWQEVTVAPGPSLHALF